MDREELEAWIIPSETNYAADEAKHLIQVKDFAAESFRRYPFLVVVDPKFSKLKQLFEVY